MLTIVASPGYSYLKGKAYQSEALQTLKHIGKLEEAYMIEHGTYSGPDGPLSDGKLTEFIGNGFNLLNLGPLGSKCIRPNVLGFSVSNCAKIRYNYDLENKDRASYRAYATERVVGEDEQRTAFQSCENHILDCSIGANACLKKDSIDSWLLNSEGEMFHGQYSESGCNPLRQLGLL
jgi:hypothetical protein